MVNFKILICDDSRLVRNQMKKYILSIDDSKYEIFEASDGRMAINMYKDIKPNLVILDIVMPIVTGIEALAEIKKMDSDAKVIIASSVGTQKYLQEAIILGAIDFVQKPLSQELVHKMLQHFDESRE